MKLSRRGKLARNLVFLLLGLGFLWFWLERPLPVALDYRRQEAAFFRKDTQVLGKFAAYGCVIGRDEEKLYLYTNEWSPRMDVFPMEDGAGRALLIPAGLQVPSLETGPEPMQVFAYEESGRARLASLKLTTWGEAYELDGELFTPYYIYEAQARKEQELFRLEVCCQEPADTAKSVWEADALVDIYQMECPHGGYRWFTSKGYSMTITFYDEAGNIVAVHESGGEFPENTV